FCGGRPLFVGRPLDRAAVAERADAALETAWSAPLTSRGAETSKTSFAQAARLAERLRADPQARIRSARVSRVRRRDGISSRSTRAAVDSREALGLGLNTCMSGRDSCRACIE